MRSEATTVDEYLAGIEGGQGEAIRTVLDVVRGAMPAGYAESVQFGMIGWGVPLERYPVTYNSQPLAYVGLGAQKRYCSLYLMGLYMRADATASFRARWSAPRALDLGKSCVRFRTAADLDLPLIAETVASVAVDDLIAAYESARPVRRGGRTK